MVNYYVDVLENASVKVAVFVVINNLGFGFTFVLYVTNVVISDTICCTQM